MFLNIEWWWIYLGINTSLNQKNMINTFLKQKVVNIFLVARDIYLAFPSCLDSFYLFTYNIALTNHKPSQKYWLSHFKNNNQWYTWVQYNSYTLNLSFKGVGHLTENSEQEVQHLIISMTYSKGYKDELSVTSMIPVAFKSLAELFCDALNLPKSMPAVSSQIYLVTGASNVIYRLGRPSVSPLQSESTTV